MQISTNINTIFVLVCWSFSAVQCSVQYSVSVGENAWIAKIPSLLQLTCPVSPVSVGGGLNLFSRSVAVTAITHSIAVHSAPGLSEDIVVIIVQNPFDAPAAHGGAETTKVGCKVRNI